MIVSKRPLVLNLTCCFTPQWIERSTSFTLSFIFQFCSKTKKTFTAKFDWSAFSIGFFRKCKSEQNKRRHLLICSFSWQTNTFQSVIVTDEVRTYAIFIYEWMGWTTHTEVSSSYMQSFFKIKKIYLYNSLSFNVLFINGKWYRLEQK